MALTLALALMQVTDAPSKPRLNHLRLAAGRWVPPPPDSLAAMMHELSLSRATAASSASTADPSAGSALCSPPVYARALGRPPGQLLAALAPASARGSANRFPVRMLREEPAPPAGEPNPSLATSLAMALNLAPLVSRAWHYCRPEPRSDPKAGARPCPRR